MDNTPVLDQITSRRSPKSQDSLSRTPSPAPVSSPETVITEPEQSPGEDDDIWDTSSDHFPITSQDEQSQDQDSHPRFQRGPGEMLSDLPALRRQHMTDGYREGLSVGKAQIMQRGFDAGYPLGVEVGLRVGNVLGVLEGIIAALTAPKGKGRSLAKASRNANTGSSSSAGGGSEVAIGLGADGAKAEQTGDTRSQEKDLGYVRSLYGRAQTELKISELLKGLDDGKITAIPDAAVPTVNDVNLKGKEETSRAIHVPEEVENVLGRWERLVLGALGNERSDNQVSTDAVKDKSVKVENQSGS